MAAIGGHHRPFRGITDEWLTPPEIIKAFSEFDLDPCSPIQRPWNTARNHFTVHDDGLSKEWFGKVWLNPPYGPETGKWLKKLSDHGKGVALIFARTETDMFFKYVWDKANSLLFIRKRIHFYRVSGDKAKMNSGAPSVLIAYGQECSENLRLSGIDGFFIQIR